MAVKSSYKCRRMRFLMLVVMFFEYSKIACSAETDLEKQQKALEAISNFADHICTKIPIEGKGSNLQLSGQAKAELNSVLKQIADLGISGTGSYNADEYQSVVRSDLASSIAHSDECRLKVFEDLKDKLLFSNQDGDISKPNLSLIYDKEKGILLINQSGEAESIDYDDEARVRVPCSFIYVFSDKKNMIPRDGQTMSFIMR